MGSISNGFALVLITVIVISSLNMLANVSVGLAQTGTPVNGIINSDTIWTKDNSLYMLTGPVLVNKDVTLTIEPGATINLNGYYIQVDGTLQAKGSSTDPIYLNGDNQYPNYGITFTSSSSSWNKQTGSGSIIENAILNSIKIAINSTSPKINSNSINGFIEAHITASPIITNNKITGGPNYQTSITGGTSSIISNNIITSKHNIAILAYDSAIVSNNIIKGSREKGIIAYGSIISNNTIFDCSKWGIIAGSGTTGESVIENNLIANSYNGIVSTGYNNIITNNTIANNTIGIYAYYPATITYNNIEDNSQYQIKLDITEKYPIDATYNWWGTTDSQAIKQSIYDNKNDFNLGSVTFSPFLTAPNPQVSPNPNAPIPTPNPSVSSPTPTPSIPEFPSVMIIIIVFLIAALTLSIFKRKSFIFKNSKKMG